jgi:tRNA pseudouridine55 synthase
MQRQVHGILLLDKPIGLTSNSALQRVKRLFKAKKAGHTGSLDPIASGMLPICFGEATKFSQFLLESDKSYQVVAKLGEQTTTGDSEGAIIATSPVVGVTEAVLVQVISKYLGEIDQIPPMFSAIKVKGKPLYELARKGIEIERSPRRITIFSMYTESLVGSIVKFHVHCSKGTYIRTLVEDIGKDLGCGAHVVGLRRIQVTPYSHAGMYTLPALEAIVDRLGLAGLSPCLLPVETSVQVFPAVTLSLAAAFYLRTGQSVRVTVPLNSHIVRLYSEEGKFLGMGEVMLDGRIKPMRLLS